MSGSPSKFHDEPDNLLQMLAPSAVQLVSDQIVLGTRAHKLAEAIRLQAAHLPQQYRFELDRLAGQSPEAQ